MQMLVAKVMHDGGHIAQQPQRQQQPKQQAHDDWHNDISRVHGDAREARSERLLIPRRLGYGQRCRCGVFFKSD
jgi:hypothetical protein